jgi:hypothetical protein
LQNKLLEAEILQVRGVPNTYVVLSEWESHEAMRAFLMQKRHIEIIRGYRRGYGKGFERRRYTSPPTSSTIPKITNPNGHPKRPRPIPNPLMPTIN